MPISSKPINAAATSKQQPTANAPRRAPLPDVVATAIAAATTAHDDTLPLQKRAASDLDDVDPKTQQPLPHARERIMAHLDDLADKAQAAEKRQTDKARALAREHEHQHPTGLTTTAKPYVKGMHIDIADRAAASRIATSTTYGTSKAAPAKQAAGGAAAAGKMLAGMATAEFAKAVKDSEKAGEVEERRHGDLWKQAGDSCSSCESSSSNGSATTTPSSAERKQKPLNVAGIRRMRAEYAARAGVTLPAAGPVPSKRAASDESSPSSSCTSTPSSAERKGKNLKPAGVARLRRELEAQFPAMPEDAARAAPAKKGAKAATGTDVAAAKMVADMATQEFAKAVKDSEKAGEVEERRHGNLWKKHGELAEEAADVKAKKGL